MRRKLRKLGYAGIGAGATVKDKFKKVGRKLVKKGKKKKSSILSLSGPKLERKMKHGIKFAGKEALVISKKSLEMLEKELKKLERQSKKRKKKKASTRKKTTKRKAAKRKTVKKKTSRKKASKRKAAKRKSSRRKVSKRKTSRKR